MESYNRITDPSDIKILVCYTLASVDSPLSKDDLCRVLSSRETVGYFDAAEAITELVRDGFICETDEGCTVTEAGVQIASSFSRKLPGGIRDEAAAGAVKLAASLRSRVENPCRITPAQTGGFTVDMRVLDGDDELMSLRLFAADREQAESLKRRFESDPLRTYTGVISVLTEQ